MKDQINKIMETEGLSPAKFADEIGVQRSSISHIISGRNKPSYDFIVKILNRFSGINAEWLITGKGNMIKSESKTEHSSLNKQSTLFDQPIKVNSEKTVQNETKTFIENTPDIQSAYKKIKNTDTDLQGTISENSKFTNVNNVKYILVFFPDGTFEQFNPR